MALTRRARQLAPYLGSLGKPPQDLLVRHVTRARAHPRRRSDRVRLLARPGRNRSRYRGIGMGAWFASGRYNPIAEQVFSLRCDRLLLEYDTEWSGHLRAAALGPVRQGRRAGSREH